MMMEALTRCHSHVVHPAPRFLAVVRRRDDGRRTGRALAASTHIARDSFFFNKKKYTKHGKKQRPRVVVEASSGIALLERYEDVLAAAPVATKCVTSWVGFTVADAVAQLLAYTGPFAGKKKEEEEEEVEGIFQYYDFRRTLRMGLFGLAFYGPISGFWYGLLDQYVMPDAPAAAVAVATKTALDQVLWAPVLVTCLFAWDLTFSGDAGESNGEEVPEPRGEKAGGSERIALKKEEGGEGIGVNGRGALIGGANNVFVAKLRRDLLPTLYVNWSFWPLFHLVNFRLVPPSDRILYINVVQVIYNVFLCYKATAREDEGEVEEEGNNGGGGGEAGEAA